jgi:mRNA interferase MazF
MPNSTDASDPFRPSGQDPWSSGAHQRGRAPYLTRVTVAQITSTIRGMSMEVPVGWRNGLDQDSVISCDNIVKVPVTTPDPQVGFLLAEKEARLSAAIHAAFDLD